MPGIGLAVNPFCNCKSCSKPDDPENPHLGSNKAPYCWSVALSIWPLMKVLIGAMKYVNTNEFFETVLVAMPFSKKFEMWALRRSLTKSFNTGSYMTCEKTLWTTVQILLWDLLYSADEWCQLLCRQSIHLCWEQILDCDENLPGDKIIDVSAGFWTEWNFASRFGR